MTDNRNLDGPVKFDFDFDEALERVAGTDPHEVVEVQKEDIPDATIDSLIEAFEASGNRTEEGDEFWYARDLQVLLEYRRWESFEDVLERAVTACREAGQEPDDHFRQATKMAPVGSGAEREILDVMMDRSTSANVRRVCQIRNRQQHTRGVPPDRPRLGYRVDAPLALTFWLARYIGPLIFPRLHDRCTSDTKRAVTGKRGE